MRLGADVDLDRIAADCHGFVGSDVAQLCLEAALQAVREQLGNIDVDADALDPELLEGIRVRVGEKEGRIQKKRKRETSGEPACFIFASLMLIVCCNPFDLRCGPAPRPPKYQLSLPQR